MTNFSFFSTRCPRCSRTNQVELALLGKVTECLHCGRQFEASHVDSTSAALDDPLHYWIHFTSHEILDSKTCSVESKDVERIPR